MASDAGEVGGHSIRDGKLFHIRAVAEAMRDAALAMGWGEERAEDMFLLGLVHDVGYVRQPVGHAAAGAEILSRSSYAYAEEVRLHGTYVADPSPELELLWLCDLSVDSRGRRCGLTSRLRHVAERFGEDSLQMRDVRRIAEHLRERGLVDDAGAPSLAPIGNEGVPRP